ncbi:MAG: hypothetical protein D3919_13865 [Candidatus Electrothrix sp. AW5]|nr:hypothetical protein [Candidatus Electrothrix gigas]
MSGVQPVSVNVIGERRIGKSSLLYHFLQTWEQRVDSPNRFVVVYLDLQDETPSDEAAFYQALGRALARSPLPASYKEFRTVLDTLFAQNLLPVFCLDEFEVLLKNNEQFTDSFFDQLRGCMNASQLMFILSSRQPLDVYAGKQNLTSDFFNLGQVVELGEFSEEEVEELLHLPLPGRENFPALSPGDQKLARQWGNRHPYLLQLAATALVEARQFRKNTAWAKKRFAKEKRRIRPVSVWKRPLSLQGIVRRYRHGLTEAAEDAIKWKTIILPLALLLLVGMVGYKLLTGQLTWTAAGDWLLKLIGK